MSNRYAMIMAGGSGTRLWPMSQGNTPKQLIPFIHGKSLLQIALERLEGLVPADRRFICAGESHQQPIMDSLAFDARQYLAEPMGRDTLNAVGLGAAVIAKRDPDAVMAIFTADHVIEPIDRFQVIVNQGYALAEQHPRKLITFGIAPTEPATGYGYLQLGDGVAGEGIDQAFIVDEFKEKPEAALAQQYFDAGPSKYLWNSGMFVWRVDTVLACIEKFAPSNHAGLMKIADAWDTDQQQAVLHEVYPTLEKISVDFAIMEPASRDASFGVAAVPMDLTWLDVGSWPSFAETCETDDTGNALATDRHVLLDTKNTLVASNDPKHLITTIGCEDMVIIHTPHATLVCPKDRAQDIKKLHAMVGEAYK